MIYKLTSVKNIIAKVFADLDLPEGTHRVSDMITWAGEAVKKIGAYPTLRNVVTGKDNMPLLQVTNYQARLPNDLVAINQVAFTRTGTAPYYPMVYASGSFDHGVPSDSTTSTSSTTVSDSTLVSLTMDLYGDTYADALSRLNNNPSIREQLESLLVSQNSGNGTRDVVTGSSDYSYVVSPGYIKTALKEGYLMVSYVALPVDAEGYPMIPDDESFEEAIYWYINMKLTYPEWKAGRVRDAVYYDTRNSWNYYRKQAYGNAMMPNTDQLEAIKNTWLRLVPDINAHSDGFATLSQQQVIYNKDR